jgi:putative redox protein
MSTRSVVAHLSDDGLQMTATTTSGHTVVMDCTAGDSGPRPIELVLVAQAGCTGMDVASILRKKRQDFRRYDVRVIGELRDDPAPHAIERIRIVHVVEGDVEVEAVRRAIELSATKYCAVTANLASGITEIHHAFVVRTADGDEQFGEVAVTGPNERLDGIGQQEAVPV